MREELRKVSMGAKGFAILEKGGDIMGIGSDYDECTIDAKENGAEYQYAFGHLDGKVKVEIDFLNLGSIKEVDDGELCWTYITSDLSEYAQEHGYDSDYAYTENQTIIDLP